MDDGVSKAQNETNTPLQYLKRLRGRVGFTLAY